MQRFFELVLCGAVLCVFGSRSSHAAEPWPGTRETFTVADGREAVLLLPENPKQGTPVPWVFYARWNVTGEEVRWMFEQFLTNGIAVATVDAGETYGNPEGRAVFTALYRELVDHHGLSPKVCLLARSRSGLMLYNWAVEHPDWVSCIGAIYPVTDLRSWLGLKGFCKAYGMTEQELAANLALHNPIDRLEPLARAGVPLFHLHGDKDKVVPLAANTLALEERYTQLGGQITVKVVEGGGHDMWKGWFEDRELTDFMMMHAVETHAGVDGR